MKFLCVSCDEAMKLMEVSPPDRGSLTVVYRCPKCAQEFAMLTNPYETQVVGSLGVNIGEGSDPSEGESKCPFSSMVQVVGAGAGASSSELSWRWSLELRAQLEPRGKLAAGQRSRVRPPDGQGRHREVREGARVGADRCGCARPS